jgi:hypothetical protein
LSLGSAEYLKGYKFYHPYVLKSIEILLNDKLKLAHIGSPIMAKIHSVDDRGKFIGASFFIP